jgi:PAS domain S-box-containing protein
MEREPGAACRLGAAGERTDEQFRRLVELSSDMYWEQDSEFRFTHLSSADALRAASLASRYLGKRRWELPFSNMTPADWQAHRALLASGRPFRDLELETLDDEGNVSWVSVSGMPVRDAHGKVVGYSGIGKDITQRKRDEALVALEHSIARALAGAEDGPSGIKAVLSAICRLEGWSVGRYFVADEARNVLKFSAGWASDEPGAAQYIDKSRGILYRPGEGLSGHVWLTGEPLWVRDVSKDARASGSARASATGPGLRAGSLVIPVKSEG